MKGTEDRALNPYLVAGLRAQRREMSRLLEETAAPAGLGRTDSRVMSFSEVVERYNQGISEDEIRAWVWYKRSLGVPMHGWERYYLKGGARAQEVEVTQQTVLYDTRLQEIRMAYAGERLGKLVREQEMPSGRQYYVVRSSTGLFMTETGSARLVAGEAGNNQQELDRLCARAYFSTMGVNCCRCRCTPTAICTTGSCSWRATGC